jgi:small subunit ribosomal protein S13
MAEDKKQDAKKHDAKKSAAPVKEKKAASIVRVLATDIDGTKTVLTGISKVRGVGNNLAHAILKKLAINPQSRLGDMSDADIERIENAIGDPASLNIPVWMLNRRKDFETGNNIHLNTSDLKLAQKNDIDLMGEVKSYKGLRHARGLKVRGQRTASTGRGMSAVGVQRKKTQQAQAKK